VGGRRGLAAEEGELDVAEAVEGEGRGPGFVAGAGEGVGVGGVGVAEVGGVDAAVGVETLGVAEARDGAARAADVQADVADHVLSHVVDGGVGGVGGIQADGVEGEGGADGEIGLRGECHGAVGRGCGGGCGPVRGVEVGCAPVGLGEAGVVGFATVNFGEGDGRGGREPGGVGDDGLVLAVGEGDVELGAEEVGARGRSGSRSTSWGSCTSRRRA